MMMMIIIIIIFSFLSPITKKIIIIRALNWI